MPKDILLCLKTRPSLCYIVPPDCHYWYPIPRPEPWYVQSHWLRHQDLDERFSRDLSRIATLHALADGLDDQLREKVQGVLESHLQSLKLPEGMSINVVERNGKEAAC